MTRSTSSIVLGVLTIAVGYSAAAQPIVKKDGSVVQQQLPDRPITQLIVKYKDDTAQSINAFEGSAKTARLASKSGVEFTYKRQMSGMAHVLLLRSSLSHAEAIALSKRLEMDANVAYAEPDEWVYPTLVPDDPRFLSLQWHYYAPDTLTGNLGGINAPAAWDVSRGQGVIVAVIDTGVTNHPDLNANVVGGYDFITSITRANDTDGRDADASDPGDWQSATDCVAPNDVQRSSSWHGSHVAGTIAALTNNAYLGAGIAYEARILPVRVLGRCGGVSSDIADAIRWAAGIAVPGVPNNTNVARVINMSLGSIGACSTNVTQPAIDDARAAGVAIVAATGNDGRLTIGQPANCQGVIAVTAHTFQGDNADYANIGPGTAISAPGGGACSTADGPGFTCLTTVALSQTDSTKYYVWSTKLAGLTDPLSAGAPPLSLVGPVIRGSSGTSMAAPHVSGVAALLFSRMPSLTPDEVGFLMTSSARPHPAGLYCAGQVTGTCGSGLLDAAAALTRLSDRTPMVTATPSASIVAGGQPASLIGVATPRNGGSSTFTYTWTQTGGPAVTLANASTPMATFTATNPGGTHTFSLTVRDSNGYRVTQTASLRSNNAPTVAPGSGTVAQGANAVVNVTATDPENDTLTYIATNLPAGSAISAATGQFTWPAVAAATGTYTFNVMANDGTVNSASVAVTVTVTAGTLPAPTPAPTPAPSGGGGGGGAFSLIQLLAMCLLLAAIPARNGRSKLIAKTTSRSR